MKTEILGIAFDNLTREEAAQKGAQMLREDAFRYVVTPNPESILWLLFVFFRHQNYCLDLRTIVQT